ncbi:MAG TPA: hypothetical protein VHB21_09155, partial [Minicystis sp.]|nr:hypothetical protein [Minicystis sp.]
KRAGRSVGEYARGGRLERDLLVDVPCEIWIPAARPDVIRGDNAARLETKLVLQGANIPCTEEAERILHERGVVVVPDFIANAGGVIAASVELHGGDETEALALLDRKIRENTRAVLEHARKAGVLPRAAALALAEARVRAAMDLHRFG